MNQVGGAFQVAFSLLTQGKRLIELRLDFARVELCQQLTRLYVLAGHNKHLVNFPADLGFDDRVQLGAHRAYDILRGDTAFAFGNLRPHGGDRQGFTGDAFRLATASGETKQGREQKSDYS